MKRVITTPRRIRSVATVGLLLGLATTGLTACSAIGSPSQSSSATSGGTAAPAPGSTSGSGSSSGSGSGSGSTTTTIGSSTQTGGGSTGTTGTGGSSDACTSSELSVAQTNPSVGAGQYYSTLVFTNTSSASCTLYGYPGVSYVAANGVQSGNPAQRAAGTVSLVTLKPGGTAQTTLHDSNGGTGYTPQQCDLTPVQGLRIYPPNEKAAIFLPWKTSHCAGTSINPFTIGPVTAG